MRVINETPNDERRKLVLHMCCAPCATYPATLLKDKFELELLFYNPCIYPKEELLMRKDAAEAFAEKMELRMHFLHGEERTFLDVCEDRSCEKEGGLRCIECFRQRLLKTAEYAKGAKAGFFATTLTISPHKDSNAILGLGKEIEAAQQARLGKNRENDLRFLDIDFKKNGGFEKSVQMAKEIGLYRQRYCGCRFSLR